MERLQEEIKKGKSEFEELVKKEALLLDIAKWWYLIRLGELGVYDTHQNHTDTRCVSNTDIIYLQFLSSELALKIPELRRRPASTYEGLRAGARSFLWKK